MTSTSGRPEPDGDDQPTGADTSPAKDAPGVELGMSEKSGGTFEPEEAPGEEDGGRDA